MVAAVPIVFTIDHLRSHTYPGASAEEEVREGFDPDEPEVHNPEADHNLSYPFVVEEQSEDEQRKQGIKPPISSAATKWENKDFSDTPDNDDEGDRPSPSYGSFREERNVWNDH